MDDFEADFGWGALPEYPAAGAAIKANKLESVLAAPVRLPSKKQKNKQSKHDDAPSGPQEQEFAAVTNHELQAAAASKPDLSSFKLPTGKRVKFAGAVDSDMEEQPEARKTKAKKEGKQPGHQEEQTAVQQSQGASKRKHQQPEEQTSTRDAPHKKKQKQAEAGAADASEPSQPSGTSKSGKQHTEKHGKQRQDSVNGSGDADGKAQQFKTGKSASGADSKAAAREQQQADKKASQPREQQQLIKPGGKSGQASARQPTEQSSRPRKQQQPQASKESKGGSLLDKMRAQLAGGRFRALNEQLYTCKGDDAFKMMQTDPGLFEQYHSGFQQQTHGWPQQPLELAAKWLSSKPSDLVVADFGCGEGRLATLVKQKVHSFDLVSAAPHVIACNMANVPLESGSTDVAVFSLALMGTDYGSFLVEATRVLRHKGWLWIAEVRSRFAGEQQGQEGKAGGGGSKHKDIDPFLHCLAKLGFQVTSLDASSNTMFFVAVLRKVNVPSCSPDKIKWPTLKACVYKKR